MAGNGGKQSKQHKIAALKRKHQRERGSDSAEVASPSQLVGSSLPSETAPSVAPSGKSQKDPCLSDGEEASYELSSSPVWEHFIRIKPSEKHKDGAVKCKICTQEKRSKPYLSDQGSTTGYLFKHLKTKHEKVYFEMRPEEQGLQEPTIKTSIKRGNKAWTKERFWELITQWMIMSSIAFNEVENFYLQECFLYCRDEAELPCADTVRNMVDKAYKEMQPKVRAMLAAAPGKLAFTTDEWTSPNTLAFKCITVHYIDSQWRLRNLIIGFEPLEGSHTAQNLHAVFTGVLASDEWQIPLSRVQSITFDNHTVNVNFMKLLTQVNGVVYGRGYRCLAHVINLAAQAFMLCGVCSAVADKVRKIAGHVLQSGSAQRMEAWLKICKRRLQLDMKVRWNSTHTMLKDAIALKQEIRQWMLTLAPEYQVSLEITEADWSNIEKLCALLAPMATATKLATSCEQPCSYVLPLYNLCYYNLLGKRSMEAYAAFRPALNSALAKFDKYYDFTTHSLSASTVVDPRWKLQHFEKYSKCAGHESLDEALEHVREELKEYFVGGSEDSQCSTASSPPPPPSTDFMEDDLMRDLFKKPKVEACDGDELLEYNKGDTAPYEEDPLRWWKLNHAKYPKLARAARDYLAGRCTSADSERAFSGGRQMISEFRHRLGPETIRKCMLLKSWVLDVKKHGKCDE